MMKLRSLILAAFLALPLTSSFGQVGISVNFAPPVLPVYEQPPCPVAGYIWTPGYWGYGYDVGDYYWVPGAWVPPPSVGLLWTPPWWGWNNGVYVFNQGYWGPRVGFYGGINYGYGYTGNGYWGGRWSGNTFQYNTAVTRVNETVVRNTYVNNSFTKNVTTNRASFNGPNGVKAEATAEQKAAAANAKKVGPTSQQLARQEAASKDRNLQASVNKGQPKPDAIKSFNKTEGQGKAGAQGPGTAAGAGAGKGENKPGNVAEHGRQGAGGPGEHANKAGTENRGNKIGAENHANRQGAENRTNNQRNLEGSQAKSRSGRMAGPGGGPAHEPRQMNQGPRQPKTATHGPQTGARNAQMGGKRPQMSGGNRPRPTGGQQQQGKKKKPGER
jgi:hypothetical protein